MNKQFDNENQSLIIELPWSRKIIFKNTNVDYKNIIINYKDITGIQYNSENFSINFIPIYQFRFFKIFSTENKISLNLSSTLYIKNGQRKKTWENLIELSKRSIEPLLIKNKISMIFNENKVISIETIDIDKNGYSKKKFLGGKEYVMWKDTIHSPQYEKGNVCVFKDNGDNKAKILEKISMEKINAVLLPELITACKNYYDKM